MTCTDCNGIGLVDKTQDGVVYAQEVCSTCNGMGFVGQKPEVKIKRIKK